MNSTRRESLAVLLVVGVASGACSSSRTAPAADPSSPAASARADLILTNARVYTLAWGEPAADGTPAADAPHGPAGWTPDAQAVAIRGSRIVFVGSNDAAAAWRGPSSRVVDLRGATLLPGLVDSHVHILELGRMLERVNLVGVASEAEAVDKVAARAAVTPRGEWILGYGWDDGAWANHYPTMKLLSERVPDHPVYLRGLHGYAVWGNRLAFERASITAATSVPAGGEIRKDASGTPSGVLVNAAVKLLESAMPAPTTAQIEALVLEGLQAMAEAGFVAVQEAGADSELMAAFEHLAATGRLPVRVYVMLSGRDHPLLERWVAKGRETPAERQMLTTLGVKVFFDGALGSRGARLLAPYADRPGHRGVATPEATFEPKLVAALMKAGFQADIHAIGDAANRDALDFIEGVMKDAPSARTGRHRIEHAQVLDADDVPRFARSGVIASMQPSHAVEDMVWAEDRLGAERVKLAYAWRTLRRAGARLVFSSDLPGTDYNAFYGLHSAIARQDRAGKPDGGWRADQRMTPEEALRGYTTWAAYAAFVEEQTGALAVGRWADLTAMDIDPLSSGEQAPAQLLAGKIRMTIVAGRVVKSAP
ncbi:MAG TPA: amidohydrolase [Kofleriaceae bacterium]|nr:amidohydrolase [Kofleriaceae bacterium]